VAMQTLLPWFRPVHHRFRVVRGQADDRWPIPASTAPAGRRRRVRLARSVSVPCASEGIGIPARSWPIKCRSKPRLPPFAIARATHKRHAIPVLPHRRKRGLLAGCLLQRELGSRAGPAEGTPEAHSGPTICRLAEGFLGSPVSAGILRIRRIDRDRIEAEHRPHATSTGCLLLPGRFSAPRASTHHGCVGRSSAIRSASRRSASGDNASLCTAWTAATMCPDPSRSWTIAPPARTYSSGPAWTSVLVVPRRVGALSSRASGVFSTLSGSRSFRSSHSGMCSSLRGKRWWSSRYS